MRNRLANGMVTSEPVEQYLKTFHWNKVKYRADKPLGEIIDVFQKVLGYPSASCCPGLILMLPLLGNL